jgi:uncharacterized protein YndB with AHSA1/START domain
MSRFSLQIVRTIDAPVEEVYAAWTVPEIMGHWMAQRVEADVRVGGRYRNEIDNFVHRGEYRVLESNARIVQTFQPSEEPSTEYPEEMLEIRLRPVGEGQTELTFTDTWGGKDMDAAGYEDATAAWSGWLDQLERLFRKAP